MFFFMFQEDLLSLRLSCAIWCYKPQTAGKKNPEKILWGPNRPICFFSETKQKQKRQQQKRTTRWYWRQFNMQLFSVVLLF